MLVSQYSKLLLSLLFFPLSILSVPLPGVYAQPSNANHGVIVCAPRLKGSGANDLGAFGDACGKYLAVSVGGRPEFGRTPFLVGVDRVRHQRGFANMRLSIGEAGQIAARTGATLLAIGMIDEVQGQVSLSYQWYTSKGSPIKTSIRIQGKREEIVKRLPGLSNQLAALLGVKSLPAPPVRATANQMILLGKALPGKVRHYSVEQEIILASLRKQVPLAAMVYLYTADAFNPIQNFAAAEKLALTGFRDNGLVFSHLGNTRAGSLAAYKARLVSLVARYPQNYPLTASLVWSSRHAKDIRLESKMARRLVKIAPQNPDAYMTLGATMSDEAHEIRQGKLTSQMTEAEREAVYKIYNDWLEIVAQAVRIDPQFAHAWLRVSGSACFAGYRELAVKAWKRSKQLGEESVYLYTWALELFHPKWGGSQEELANVAREAAEADYVNANEIKITADALKQHGFENEATRLIRRSTKE